jgi:hypothetical protein
MPFPCILFHFYFDIWPNESLSISENFRNIWESSLIHLGAPSRFVLIFFLRIVFFPTICLIYGSLLLNTNMLWIFFFYSCLKRANNNKG